MSRPSSSHNGTRPTITQNANVRLVPPPRPSPGTVPANVQAELGPHRTTPTRLHTLHSTSPVSARQPARLREAFPRQLPPSHTLQRRPPTVPQTQTQTQAAVSFLDNAFRSYAERIQAELTNLRAVCTRAIFREQQDKEKWRRHCVTFKQERDVARERVRALIGEREAHMALAGPSEEEWGLGSKRPRDENAMPSEHTASRDSTPSSTTTVTVSDPDDESNVYSLTYTPPTYLPLAIESTPPPRSPPPRSRSADAVLYSGSDFGANKKPYTTAFDVTLTEPPTGERRVQMEPAKKRRRKGSPSRTSDSGSSSSSSTVTVVEEVTPGEAKMPCRPGLLGKDHLGVEEVGVQDITNKPKATPDSYAQVSSSTLASKSATPKIDLAHVDLMYVPTNGKLVCRACLLHCNKLPQSPRPSPTSFPTNAQWDLLRNHCMTQHPAECAEVARLHPAEVYELRRRLIMRP